MKILLFNDNPVVRKLVALSAQKTKDELSVVWSVDEIEESEFDLLIMDDALYSDETFESINEYIRYRSALLMATRGNAVPAGFDNVINKPFLPTDLVDMFIQIQKNLESSTPQPAPAAVIDDPFEEEEEPSFSINLEDTLPDLAAQSEEMFRDDELDADMELGGLDELEDDIPLMNILDQEEVDEVRGLLEDTENDELFGDEAITVAGFDDIEIPQELEAGEDEAFDFALLTEDAETAGIGEETEDEAFNFDDIIESLKEELPEEESAEAAGLEEALDMSAFEESGFDDDADELAGSIAAEEPFDLDDAALADMMLLEDEEALGEESAEDGMDEELFAALNAEVAEELKIDDSELEDLAMQIQEAVDELAPEDLDMDAEGFEMDLDEGMLEDLNLDEAAAESGEFDELDMLDERELKLAIGEDTEDEIDIRVGEGGHASLNIEALGEVIGKSVQMASSEQTAPSETKSGGAEGVEAIQALLKALANEEVAKSLKGLNISININFGNDK